MKTMMPVAILAVSLCSNAAVNAQEKPKVEEKTETRKDITPLRVQVVLSEYEGEKKISSLPYTFSVTAGEKRQEPTRVRMGLRVPIATGSFQGPGGTTQPLVNTQFQYQDVGTNLDCFAIKEPDGRFFLHLSVERSSVYSPNADQKLRSDVSSGHPVVENFRNEFDLLIHDGQTIQSTAATDPVSGRVTKAEVTVNVMK